MVEGIGKAFIIIFAVVHMSLGRAYFDPIWLPSSSISVSAFSSRVTVVSGHWVLAGRATKHPIHLYQKWWKNALSINAPLVFYTDNTDVVRLVKAIRGYRPTVLKYRNLTTDMMSRFRDFKDSWVNRKDVPSKEIGVIWLDKIFMIEETMRANPFGTDWFCWNDAGNAYYRHAPIRSTMWPSQRALSTLPTNKFIYSSSWFPITEHSVAGTSFMLHKNIITQLTQYFWAVYHSCNDKKCGSDQILFSRMKESHPDFFYQVGYGYGVMIEKMFLPYSPHTSIHNRSDVCSKNSGILLDIFQIMKNTEKKNLGDAGFKGLCKPLWKKEYPNWKEDFNNFKKNIQREKESDIMRQRFKTRMRYDRSRIEG